MKLKINRNITVTTLAIMLTMLPVSVVFAKKPNNAKWKWFSFTYAAADSNQATDLNQPGQNQPGPSQNQQTNQSQSNQPQSQSNQSNQISQNQPNQQNQDQAKNQSNQNQLSQSQTNQNQTNPQSDPTNTNPQDSSTQNANTPPKFLTAREIEHGNQNANPSPLSIDQLQNAQNPPATNSSPANAVLGSTSQPATASNAPHTITVTPPSQPSSTPAPVVPAFKNSTLVSALNNFSQKFNYGNNSFNSSQTKKMNTIGLGMILSGAGLFIAANSKNKNKKQTTI